MNGATVRCDTTSFDNNSFIYWQYNCDSIWLTLENDKKEKLVIDKVPVEVYNYTFRLGYHLIKEFRNSLLFRKGCAAMGPCTYDLVDKNDGKKIKTFRQLICIDTDSKWTNAHKYGFDFVAYFETIDKIVVEYIDSGERLTIPIKENFYGAVVPEQQFDDMTLDSNLLTLEYRTLNKERKKLTIDLREKKYSR
jgi:hypothetical protein